MSVTAIIGRIVSTLVAMLHTRLDLVSVELEEELLRFSSYFIYSLIALFCGGVAISLGIFLVIALFWDDHRVAVLVSLIIVFGATSVFIANWLRVQFLNKPRLLEQSIAEFKKDSELLRAHEQESAPQTESEQKQQQQEYQ